MKEAVKVIGTVATGATTGGVVAGVPGIVIGVIFTVGLAIASKTLKDK